MSKRVCRNCDGELSEVRLEQYALTDPWNTNVYQVISERVCPKCGNRNKEIQFVRYNLVKEKGQEKRPALQCGSVENLVRNSSI